MRSLTYNSDFKNRFPPFFVDSNFNLAVKLIFGACDCGQCECSSFCFNAGKIRPMSSRGSEIVIELWLV